jgi:hypothetical protein
MQAASVCSYGRSRISNEGQTFNALGTVRLLNHAAVFHHLNLLKIRLELSLGCLH